MSAIIQFKRGKAAAIAVANPILAAGEPGFETDTGKLKIGNGVAAWNSLSYINVISTTSGAPAPYSARVFISSGKVYVNDKNGNILYTGTAGIDDLAALNYGRSYVSGLSPRGLLVLDGAFSISAPFAFSTSANDEIQVLGVNRARITCIADCILLDIFDVRDLDICGLELRAIENAISPMIRVKGNSRQCKRNYLHKMRLFGSTTKSCNAIEVICHDFNSAVFDNVIEDFYIENAKSMLLLHNETSGETGGFLNDNVFRQIWAWKYINGIEFGGDGYTSSGSYGYSKNCFQDIDMQASSDSKYGIKQRKGHYNVYINVVPDDLPSGSTYCDIAVGKDTNNDVIGFLKYIS